MSYVLTPYLIDLEKLRKAVGSRDESLVASVIKDNREKSELTEPLRQLVMGNQLDEAAGSDYGYALELLCGHLGEVLLPDVWGGVRWMAVEDAGLEDLLTKSGPPVPLPPTDFPTIGHMTAAEVATKVAQLGKGHLTSDDDELQELLDEYEGWLRKAALKKKAIVFFYD
jgi:hypothetical protein